MRRAAMSVLVGLGAALALAVAACAPAEPPPTPTPQMVNLAPQLGLATPEVTTPTPGAEAAAPGTGTPAPAAASPGTEANATSTEEVRGAQATPSPTATPDTETVQALMRDIQQFQSQLQRWEGGKPSPNDLVDMVERAGLLMMDLSQTIPEMAMREREQALGMMSDVVHLMPRVVQTHAQQLSGQVTPVGTQEAELAMGTPTTPTPLPAAAPTPTTEGFQQMMARIDQLRNELMRLASNEPSHADIIRVMDEMEGVLVTMAQQVDQLSTQEMEVLTSDLALALDDLVIVMEAHLQQEMGLAPQSSPT